MSEQAKKEFEEESGEEASSKRINVQNAEYSCFELFAIAISYILLFLTFPFFLIFCFRIVFEYERAVIFRLGKLRNGGARGLGLIFVLFCVDECVTVDLRTETVNIYPQQLLTKDSVSIKLEAVIFFRLQDAIRGVLAVGNYKYATILLAQAVLRNIVAEKTLLELLLERAEIFNLMHVTLMRRTRPWGVVVERVEIKNIRLPIDLQRSMAAEAEANRVAEAKVVSAEGEKLAANALKIASQIISSSPGAIQMRYLQTLRSTVEDNNNIYILPLSKEIFQLCNSFLSRL